MIVFIDLSYCYSECICVGLDVEIKWYYCLVVFEYMDLRFCDVGLWYMCGFVGFKLGWGDSLWFMYLVKCYSGWILYDFCCM